jgi:hypothetical protein
MRGLSSRNSASALLPEFAMVEPVWESEHFDPARWSAIEILNAMHLRHLADLRAEYVVGTRPVTLGGRRLNQGCLWYVADGVQPTAEQGREQGDWASRASAPPPGLLAQLSGRFASPRNLW